MKTDNKIFTAIESHRGAEAAYATACEMEDEGFNELVEVSHKRLAALLPMTPTTVAGCAAMLRHVAEYAASYDQNVLQYYCEDVKEPASTLLMRIAAALDRASA